MPRTVDPRRHAARRAEILDAAARCFALRGFDGTTTAEVCLAAGIGSGTFFHYFPTKRAVLHAIWAEEEVVHARHAAEALEQADPFDGLWLLMDRLAADARLRDQLGLAYVVVQQVDRDPQLATIVARTEAATHRALTRLVRRCAQAGDIDPPVDAKTTASWVRSLIDGVYFRLAGDAALDTGKELAVLRLALTRFLGCTRPVPRLILV